MMLEQRIVPAARRMPLEFSSHQYIERIRQLYPADYAHDLAVCTVERGFAKSLAVMHRAITDSLQLSGLVSTVGSKRSKDLHGNKHQTLLWRRRRPDRTKIEAPLPLMTGSELKQARLAKGWTIADLARASGLTATTIRRWEHGRLGMRRSSFDAIRRALRLRRRIPKPRKPWTGSELREARRAGGWSVAHLSRAVGVSAQSITRWERSGCELKPAAAEAIQAALRRRDSPTRQRLRELAKTMSQADAARQLGISRERVRQLANQEGLTFGLGKGRDRRTPA